MLKMTYGGKDYNFEAPFNLTLCLDAFIGEAKENTDKINELQTEIKQLKGEEAIPDAWWKDCPELAQRTMERIMEKNVQLQARIKELSQGIIDRDSIMDRHKQRIDELEKSEV